MDAVNAFCECIAIIAVLDGHSTHYQLNVVHFAKDKEALMLCLPSQTTCDVQLMMHTHLIMWYIFSPLQAQRYSGRHKYKSW